MLFRSLEGTGSIGTDTAYLELAKTFNFRAGRWGYTVAAPASNSIYVIFVAAWLCSLFSRKKWLALAIMAIPLFHSFLFFGDYGYASFVPLIVTLDKKRGIS